MSKEILKVLIDLLGQDLDEVFFHLAMFFRVSLSEYELVSELMLTVTDRPPMFRLFMLLSLHCSKL